MLWRALTDASVDELFANISLSGFTEKKRQENCGVLLIAGAGMFSKCLNTKLPRTIVLNGLNPFIIRRRISAHIMIDWALKAIHTETLMYMLTSNVGFRPIWDPLGDSSIWVSTRRKWDLTLAWCTSQANVGLTRHAKTNLRSVMIQQYMWIIGRRLDVPG